MIRRLLIANRGEIAVRVARTAREMGIETVGVRSEADAGPFHVSQTDRAVSLGEGPPLATYLSIEKMLEAARSSGADAVHPGYGFLSESAAFARAVREAGLTWIGPDPESIEAMGDKLRARERAAQVGVPVVPGSSAVTAAEAEREAKRLRYPVLVKAAAGGGGKGMARVNDPSELAEALAQARRLAGAAFGNETVYLEKLLDNPRHVEVQVFGDRRGNLVHLFERECSVQRRHQKIVEETPSAALTPELRAAMGKAAVLTARAVRYVGAGTVEFLLDASGDFYFLEMNTRLQVEHAITEETLGVDLVRAQIEVASGAELAREWRDGALTPRGHAIEMRLYAEDPEEFLPRAGRLLAYEEPRGPGIRVDAGVAEGSVVGLDFDPLLAKLVVHAEGRHAAIERARRALSEWVVLGVETNLPLLSAVLASPEFTSGRYDTGLVGRLPSRRGGGVPDAAWVVAGLVLQGVLGESGSPLGSSDDPWASAAGWRPLS
ncbi:MAG TPA: biotin carboxylase N-terminal domain-containing protein [Thermoanaerobaculia bacterium]|nr:biotin carboxylase N-terminal domain-containing protein [Thermoanaerobaculia bacterium]